MRNTGQKLLEALDLIESTRLIPIIEKGLEIEKLEYQINDHDDDLRDRIYDAEILLTFLYMRRLGHQ